MSPTVRLAGLELTDHEVTVPLDHAQPEGEQITVFAREVGEPDGRARPFLLFLQGGPGQESPRPVPATETPGWLYRAVKDFRVLLLDQRGTGRSSPVGELPGLSPHEQAERLALFRADAIVADAEVLRSRLEVDRWSLLGQSFGGFCAMRYLSAAPGAVREALFTGGVPPVARLVDDVYAATWQRMLAANRRFHERYPEDIGRLRTLLDRAESGSLCLLDGEAVGARRLRSIGNVLGMSDGPEHLHYLLERDPASPAFRHDLAELMPFSARAPIYAAVHEAGYADGSVTGWSAQRTMPDEFREDPSLLFGEHVFSWTFEDDPGLAPLAEAAELLAAREWPTLYDAEVLRAVDVPCAAAVYADDPYVERRFSEETASMIPTMRTWVTDEHSHNALRADGARILDRLLGMTRS
jgi:pimeloyl-ACP methyl ester carboxylesterase